MKRLWALAEHPKLPWLLFAASAVLTLPALSVGWVVDDWFHQAMIRGIQPPVPLPEPLLGMFDFLGGGPERAHQLRNHGFGPWWLPDDLHARFLRPITVLTHLADHAIAPTSAVFAHAHSIAWSAGTVAAVTMLYRRVASGTAVAALAAVLFLLDEARGIPTGWVANRSALPALVFGVLTLIVHVRWRRDGWRPGVVVGPLLLTMALLSAESGLATTAYLFAFAVHVDKGPLRGRLVTLLPYAAVVLAWRAVYSHMGYGASGSGLYIDPVAQPDRFLAAAAMRLPVLQLGQWVSVPTVAFGFFPGWLKGITVALSVGVLALVGVLLRPVLASKPSVRMWVVGSLLAGVPICATFTSNRLLGFVSIGGFGLLAELVVHHGLLGAQHVQEAAVQHVPRWRRWAILFFAVPPLVLGPAWIAVASTSVSQLNEALFAPCQRAIPEDPSIADKTVIFVNSNALCVGYTPVRRVVEGRPRPAYVRLLSSAIYEVHVVGVDERTIDVVVPDGFQSHTADQLMRSGRDPLPAGHVVALDGMTITVQDHTPAGHMKTVRVALDRPLGDPSLVWIATRNREPSPFTPPRPGQEVVLPAAF